MGRARWFILPGAVVVGLIIKWLTGSMCSATKRLTATRPPFAQFLLVPFFNMIVLAREGWIPSSRAWFFLHGRFRRLCLLLAKLLYWLFDNAGAYY